MGGKHRNISQYRSLANSYKARSLAYREKYGDSSPQYLAARDKAYNFNKAVKRAQNLNNRIAELAEDIKEFMGEDVKRTKDPKTKEGKAAKGIFIKYGMQNGIKGLFLGNYIGLKGNWSASRYRIRFTKSFSKNNYNREMYYRFLEFKKRKS